jgi:hypothetical protein
MFKPGREREREREREEKNTAGWLVPDADLF